jgi:CheY-like chemotaxis protein
MIQRAATPFDLVMTDVTMPVMSGSKLGRSLARMRPWLPVLYLSTASEGAAFGQPIDRSLLLNQPYLPEDLVGRVVALPHPVVEASASPFRGSSR